MNKTTREHSCTALLCQQSPDYSSCLGHRFSHQLGLNIRRHRVSEIVVGGGPGGFLKFGFGFSNELDEVCEQILPKCRILTRVSSVLESGESLRTESLDIV
jgi:hypothetical protein